MFLQKHLRILTVGVLFGTLALFSCAQKSPTSSASENNGVGKAVVHLPDLSSSGLKKLPVGVDTNALTLLIVGTGMDTIKYSWPVTTLKGQTVVINGIPAGSNRNFEGFLTNKSGVLTHSGKVIVNVIAGQEVPVNLKLSGTGSADVCIEIEGYPSACGQNDSLFIYNCLSVSAKSDYTDGTLKLYVYGNTAAGTLTFINAKKDSSEFYDFDKTIKIVDSVSYKYFYATVYERTTRIRHSLYMIINQNLEVVYGVLSKDTTLMNNPIAKFYYVKCSTPVTDTITVSSCIRDRSSSDSITGHMDMYIYGKNTISGLFEINNTHYSFSKLINLTDSANITCIKAIIYAEQYYGSNQYYFNMYLDKKSQNWSGYIFKDSLFSSPIVEIQSTPCYTPVKDSIDVNKCISGSLYTGTNNISVSGWIQMYINKSYISGEFLLQDVKNSSSYVKYGFKRLVSLNDTTTDMPCRAIVIDSSSNLHLLGIKFNEKSEFIAATLFKDTLNSIAISKFMSVKCDSVIVKDTLRADSLD